MTGFPELPSGRDSQESPRRTTRLVLASQSPRRRRLLAWLGLPFSATAVDTPEDLDTPLARDPSALAESLAAEKAVAACAHGLPEDALVICFDTIVVLDGTVLGKPADVPDAWRMLRALSGRTHQVVTGVALAGACRAPETFSVTTSVTMRPLTDGRIEEWMARGHFMGCAGAYNIEDQIAEVTEDECYQNVAGLPLCHLHVELARLAEDGQVVWPGGIAPTVPIAPCDAALGRHCCLGPRLIPPAR